MSAISKEEAQNTSVFTDIIKQFHSYDVLANNYFVLYLQVSFVSFDILKLFKSTRLHISFGKLYLVK